MIKPELPSEDDCCNSGCNPCIFDVYEKQLKLYETYIKNGEIIVLKENAISELEYRNFEVIENVKLCDQHHLISFKTYNAKDIPSQVYWNPGDHFLVKYKCDESNCTRAYTPIKYKLKENGCDFSIIVKRYENGLVSNYLCDINKGEISQWRGPYGGYKLSDQVNRVVMIAQGTAITSVYSFIEQILSDEDNMTRIVLLYCSKCIDCILLRDALYEFQSFWNFTYGVYLSEEAKDSPIKYQEPIINHKLGCDNLFKYKPFTDKDQFLLCGSDSFMEHYNVFLRKENVPDKNIVIIK